MIKKICRRPLIHDLKIVACLLVATSALLPSCDASDPSSERLFASYPGEILFISNKSGSMQLFSMRPDGGDLRQITNDPSFPIYDAVWSPDGSRIALTSPVGGNRRYGPSLYVVNADGTDLRPVFEPNDDRNGMTGSNPVWSPDGERIAFKRLLEPEALGIYDIFIAHVKTGRVEKLNSELGIRTPTDWLQDEDRIVGFAEDRSAKDSLGRSIIYDAIAIWNLEGELLSFIGEAGLGYSWPLVSPSQDNMVYRFREQSAWALYISDSNGNGATRLVAGEFNSVVPKAYGPSGRRVLAEASVDTPEGWISRMLIVETDGTGYADISPFSDATTIPTDWRAD